MTLHFTHRPAGYNPARAKTARPASEPARAKASCAKIPRGFTLIEVTIVLAITGLMFSGLVIATRHNINGQRYSAATQDFDSLLRQIYNQVENVQITDRSITNLTGSSNYCVIDGAVAVTVGVTPNTVTKYGSKLSSLAASGRSGCSVYGKLVTFGEGLPSSNSDSKAIYVYDVLGDVVDARNTLISTDEKESLREVHLGIIAQRNGTRVVSSYSYKLDWGAWIEDKNGTRLSGALLVVRSPLSGTIHTYWQSFSESQINITANYLSTIPTAGNLTANLSGYTAVELDFCVNSEDRASSAKRRNIRLSADASNASDIVLVSQDTGDNEC